MQSDRVAYGIAITQQIIFPYAGLGGVCLILALLLHPGRQVSEWTAGLWAGVLAGAWVLSCIAAGVASWAALRIRRVRIAILALSSLVLFAAATAYAYAVIFP